MPALPDVPHVCKIIISGTYHDARWNNIWYVNYTGGAPSSADINTYLTYLRTNVGGKYVLEMSADNEITGWEGIDLTSATANRDAITDSEFGVRAGDFMPAGVAMVCSLEVNRRYRGGHPRKYLPWGTAGTMASGSTIDWDSGFVADCETKMTDIMGYFQSGTGGSTAWDQVVNVSYRTGHAVRGSAVVDPVTSTIIRPRICSQRRRLGKIGG